MDVIYTGQGISFKWKITRNASELPEDFSRADLQVFFVGSDFDGNHDGKYWWQYSSKNDGGYITVDIPTNSLTPGTYCCEAVWIKNRHELLDAGSTRTLSRARKDRIFKVSNVEAECTDYNPNLSNWYEQPHEIIVNSGTTSYGYDGMSAYETAVFNGIYAEDWGDIPHSEKAWIAEYQLAEERVNYEMDPDNNGITVGDHQSWANKIDVEWAGEEGDRQDAEDDREEAETERQQYEGQGDYSDFSDYPNTRRAKEDDRQEAEGQGDYSDTTTYPNTRRAKEAARQTAETARATQELNRQNNETSRKRAEGQLGTSDSGYATSRVKKEIDRQAAEAIRVSAENTRLANEGIGDTAAECADGSRRKNEYVRMGNEDTRITQETARKKAEGQLGATDPDYATSRIKQEIDRQAAEALREQAEIARENAKISSTAIEYAVGDSGTTPPVSGWQAAVPSYTTGDFLWGRTTITFGDGSTKVLYAIGGVPTVSVSQNIETGKTELKIGGDVAITISDEVKPNDEIPDNNAIFNEMMKIYSHKSSYITTSEESSRFRKIILKGKIGKHYVFTIKTSAGFYFALSPASNVGYVDNAYALGQLAADVEGRFEFTAINDENIVLWSNNTGVGTIIEITIAEQNDQITVVNNTIAEARQSKIVTTGTITLSYNNISQDYQKCTLGVVTTGYLLDAESRQYLAGATYSFDNAAYAYGAVYAILDRKSKAIKTLRVGALGQISLPRVSVSSDEMAIPVVVYTNGIILYSIDFQNKQQVKSVEHDSKISAIETQLNGLSDDGQISVVAGTSLNYDIVQSTIQGTKYHIIIDTNSASATLLAITINAGTSEESRLFWSAVEANERIEIDYTATNNGDRIVVWTLGANITSGGTIDYDVTTAGVVTEVDYLMSRNTDIIIVDANGKGDYTDLQTAMDNAQDSPVHPKTILVMPGQYEMPTKYSADAVKAKNRYLSIIGTDKNNCILYNNKGDYRIGMSVDNACLQIAGNVYIANLTIISRDSEYVEVGGSARKSYCIHCDFDAPQGSVCEIHNCRLINDHFVCVGIGLRTNYTVKITDCDMECNLAAEHLVNYWGSIYCHDGDGATGVQKLIVANSRITCKNGATLTIGTPYQGDVTVDLSYNASDTALGFIKTEYTLLSKLCYGNNVASMNYSD